VFNGHPEVTTKMKTLKMPTLVMWGEEDAWVPVSHVENWKRDVPHAETIVYTNAGHIPMEEFPEKTAFDAHRFLSSNKVESPPD
jgi:pimeloyl-ACP methyl ester carboxylesterase